MLNALFLTPLPGTRLWDQMTAEGRLLLDEFPRDWQYCTLTLPVARHRQLTQAQAIEEMQACDRWFYAWPRMLRRVLRSVWQPRQPLVNLFGSLSYRRNSDINRAACAQLGRARGERRADQSPGSPASSTGRRGKPCGTRSGGPCRSTESSALCGIGQTCHRVRTDDRSVETTKGDM